MKNLKQICDEVQKELFGNFTYVTDKEQFGVAEYWNVPEDLREFCGDCDDYALACRKALAEKGVTETRLIICQCETGEWHLVCGVGQYILDNRYKNVQTAYELKRIGYKFYAVSGYKRGDEWKKVISLKKGA